MEASLVTTCGGSLESLKGEHPEGCSLRTSSDGRPGPWLSCSSFRVHELVHADHLQPECPVCVHVAGDRIGSEVSVAVPAQPMQMAAHFHPMLVEDAPIHLAALWTNSACRVGHDSVFPAVPPVVPDETLEDVIEPFSGQRFEVSIQVVEPSFAPVLHHDGVKVEADELGKFVEVTSFSFN